MRLKNIMIIFGSIVILSGFSNIKNQQSLASIIADIFVDTSSALKQ